MEVLAALTALHFHITIIQGDQVWSSRPSGAQITDLTLMLLKDGVVFCDHINIVPRVSVDTCPTSALPLSEGQNVLTEHDSSNSGESLSDYYFEGQQVHVKMGIDLQCPVCQLTAALVMLLQEHLHAFHKDTKPYMCE